MGGRLDPIGALGCEAAKLSWRSKGNSPAVTRPTPSGKVGSLSVNQHEDDTLDHALSPITATPACSPKAVETIVSNVSTLYGFTSISPSGAPWAGARAISNWPVV